jgi:hypothetical protein
VWISAALAPWRQSPGRKRTDETETFGESLPQRRKMAGFGHQHMVARRKRINERRLPGARSRRRINDHIGLRFEDTLHPGEHRFREDRELRAAMIDRCVVDRA